MSDINQDDIDKLLQDALAGGGQDAGADSAPPAEVDRGPASQDDIDALFAAVGEASAAATPPPAPAKPPSPAPAPEPEPDAAPSPLDNLDGVADQNDIDALFSAVSGAADHPEPAAPPLAAAPAADGGVASQDDIDAAFAALNEAATKSAPDGGPDTDIVHKAGDTHSLDPDLDALLSAIDNEPQPPAPAKSASDAAKNETVAVDTVDMDELLKQITKAAPPPPPPHPSPPPRSGPIDENADTAILDFDLPDVLSAARPSSPPPQREAAPPPPPPPMRAEAAPPPTAAYQYQPQSLPAGGQREEFTVLRGAGEVESVANQISSMLAALTEKAHRYMQAWMAADSEAKELRARALAEERRRTILSDERDAMAKELDAVRRKIGEVEGEKIAVEEARRTLETAHQAKIRELESSLSLLNSEAETLKDELVRARNQSTGVDIESRRNRFEAERLKNELESERMERLRIQRALDNREKEIQAVQAQASGQASSLFIDELHRLVRRLESELDARSSGAHEALRQLDRLEIGESMVPVVANIRAALMQAIGAEEDADDALKTLGREASGIRGPQALAPGKTEMVSFETALSTYNFSGAMDVAGALLREAKATAGALMRKIYQCPALRRGEVAEHLDSLSRLLEGLRTIQESSDRSRGKETGESEVFYVQMFDFLHNLVRLKIINRLAGDIWRIFLDLRGRFSFVTSDKQWADYRDGVLNDKNPTASSSGWQGRGK